MERIKIYNMKLKEIKEKNKKDGNNENEQNKTKEKEENLSGIKSEGEAEDDEKCQQEKNLENQNQENKEINNNNDKEKDNDKKSNKSSNKNDNIEKIIENKDENLEENKNENNENNNNNENQNKEELKNNKINKNNNNKDKNKYESTNLKYFHENKAKYQANIKKKKKIKLIKPKTNSFLMMETKEELEEKINKLKEDYDKLNQKTNAQLEEEFYQYLEIDDINAYRKKMVGYIYPFQNREMISRFPLQSVARPVKRDPKMQKEMHKILIQRHEDLKKEKELKQIREKNILFEKRKKKFEVENKKIQQKMSLKNDYLQFKRNEEDYQKEKMNKLTWQQIQNCDYDTFIISEKDRKKNNLDEIFTSKNNQFEGDDGDYLKNFRLKKGFSEI